MGPVQETLTDRYGPWALVLGASDGVGAAYARAMAERGLNVVLLARREALLDQLAVSIRADTGVDARAVAVDLAGPDAMSRIAEATADIDIGMVFYCAGADPNYQPFLAQPVDAALAMVQRNCVVPLQVFHHFAGPMVERGRGGLVLLSSGAGLIGAPNMVAYGGSKAFDIVMTESLWAELHDERVDVLGLVLGATDTPALRKLLSERGVLPDGDVTTPIPGASTVDEVVADAIAKLAEGPTWFVGEQLREGSQALGGMPRNDAVRLMTEHGGALMNARLGE
jgi:short-subunit dehydrogenase